MKRETGLEARVPQKGAAADCFAVAQTAVMFCARALKSAPAGWLPGHAAHHAVTLHRISGQLRRMGERECDQRMDEAETARFDRRRDGLQAQAAQIAEHYGLRCYFQADPRGCALYLIDPDTMPDGETLRREGTYTYPRDRPDAEGFGVSYSTLEARWIEANYNHGHAVVQVGR